MVWEIKNIAVQCIWHYGSILSVSILVSFLYYQTCFNCTAYLETYKIANLYYSIMHLYHCQWFCHFYHCYIIAVCFAIQESYQACEVVLNMKLLASKGLLLSSQVLPYNGHVSGLNDKQVAVLARQTSGII